MTRSRQRSEGLQGVDERAVLIWQGKQRCNTVRGAVHDLSRHVTGRVGSLWCWLRPGRNP
jgi:hypothetical protein